MFSHTIDEKTKHVFEKIAATEIAVNFYLAGGTALAIQLGHRKSIDLDWFSAASFENGKIKNLLSKTGKFSVSNEEDGTVHGALDGVKVSFLRYNYELLFKPVDFLNVKLADERDIAAMKIDAVSARGSKKDFIDLFFLLRKYSLGELFGFFETKFRGIDYNRLHILKSLTYFEDAEGDPMPVMLAEADWEMVKEKITKDAIDYLNKKP